MRTYLFTDKSVLAIEHEAEHGGEEISGSKDGALGIGSLKSR